MKSPKSPDAMKSNPHGVTMKPAGVTSSAPAKPSAKIPAVIKAQAKPVAKPAPKVKPAKAADAKEITPYGKTC